MKIALFAAVALIALAPVAHAQASYKKDIPAALAKRAKVTEPEAAAAVMARVPKGQIEAMELEEEGGKFIYSYDVKTPGKSGIDEVHVDAMTGKVVKLVHETPAMEKKEAAADAKEKKAAKAKP
ncbi:MAG: PepSY domain protein [Gemmatimonadetes bacterium]|nr:PepSY domain protein [Gemmatimonadota bacterium]